MRFWRKKEKKEKSDSKPIATPQEDRAESTQLAHEHPILCLHDAALRGDVKLVKALLKEEPDLVNALLDSSTLGSTPLIVAAGKGHAEVARVLLAHGANVNARNRMGSMPLHEAAIQGHVEVARVLLTEGAKVNARGPKGFMPLHVAAIQGHVEVVELLVNEGADVNAQMPSGLTPLQIAIRSGHTRVAELLRRY